MDTDLQVQITLHLSVHCDTSHMTFYEFRAPCIRGLCVKQHGRTVSKESKQIDSQMYFH